MFAIRYAGVDSAKLLDRIITRYNKLPPFTNTQEAIETIESAYNYNNKKNVLYLSMEYDKAMRENFPGYANRWSKFE